MGDRPESGARSVGAGGETNPAAPAGADDLAGPKGNGDPVGTGGTTSQTAPAGAGDPAGAQRSGEPAGSGGQAEPAGPEGQAEPAGPEGQAEPAQASLGTEPPQVAVSIHIDAPADEVYDLVADLTRMGEWSPECTSVVWRGGAKSAGVGARFRGWNRRGPIRWFTDGTVVEAERGRALSFDVVGLGMRVARWAYRFEPNADGRGCTVTEEWTDQRSPAYRAVTGVVINVRDRPSHNRAGMERTLAELKAAAEAQTRG